MKVNLFKNTYAAIAALFIAMLALPTAVHAQGKARIILEAHDVWGDGSGYQMLLDADHNLYGDKFQADGPLWNNANPPADLYNGFEYKIPANADPSTTPQHMILDGEGYVDIPAGIYDFCIAAPQANAKIWIAGNYDGPTRADDYKFEAGKTYRFTMHKTENGGQDAAKLTITNSGPVQNYDLTIAGVQVTPANCNNLSVISGVSGTVKYDPSSNVLTLQNATINAGTKNAIHSNIEGLKINVVGTNNLKAVKRATLYCTKTMYVTGNGVLNSTSDDDCAIYAQEADLTIENCTVNADGRFGITGRKATEKITIKNATITTRGKGTGSGEGSLCGIKELNLIGCKITQPAGAVFDPVKHDVVLNGKRVTDKVVIEPTGGGSLLFYENFDATTAAIEGRTDYYQLPSNWSTIDADGDGYNWLENGFEKNGYGGTGKCATSESYTKYPGGKALTPDNYLITPRVAGAARVTFYACAQDKDNAKEHFAVCASTTGKNKSDFKVIKEWTISEVAGEPGNVDAQTVWTLYDVALPAGTQYVAFRHFNTNDQYRINIDEVKVYGDPTAVEHITADVPAAAKKGIYTLSGVRLQGELKNLPKGIYIVNGQKVVKQ